MHEPEEITRQALADHYGPSPEARSRMLAQLRAGLGPGPGGDGAGEGEAGHGGPDPSVPTGANLGAAATRGADLAWAAKIVGATLGLSAAGLLALALVAGVVGPTHKVAEDEAAQTAGRAQPPAQVERPTATAPSPALGARAGPDSGEAVAPPALQAELRSRGSKGAGAPDRAEPQAPSLAAELALIDRAQRSRASKPAAALEALDAHARSFAGGELAPEREVLRVEILCGLGRASEIDLDGLAELEGVGPGLRARIEASCVGRDSRDKPELER